MNRIRGPTIGVLLILAVGVATLVPSHPDLQQQSEGAGPTLAKSEGTTLTYPEEDSRATLAESGSPRRSLQCSTVGQQQSRIFDRSRGHLLVVLDSHCPPATLHYPSPLLHLR